MLDINNLSVSYGKTRVVRNLSLKVNDGEIVCIVGESGCGKSTALKSVLMLDKNASITGGSIIFNEKDITKLNSVEIRHIRGLEIAMILILLFKFVIGVCYVHCRTLVRYRN